MRQCRAVVWNTEISKVSINDRSQPRPHFGNGVMQASPELGLQVPQLGLHSSTYRLPQPETFQFLGFTHICGRSRRGKFLMHRRTIKKRMRSKLRTIRSDLMRRRHLPVPDQGRWLNSVVRGHYAYYAVPTNIQRLESFRKQVVRHWRHALMRRSQRHRMTWDRMSPLADRWIPKARIQHPWPSARFDAKYPR